jgi:hypothetical protein
MTYSELVQAYFERSTALQWYWTIYVIVIGGLLAFSSLRQQKDLAASILLTILYVFFAYKNLGAIGDVTMERLAILSAIKQYEPDGPERINVERLRTVLEPTLLPLPYPNVRNFHILSDVVTIATFWAMERRRRRRDDHASAADTAKT